ncbi:MAG: DM13 domain-containing protein [Nanoarchaeota archaeon]|nr:DM13 domain-containing protein [Nanoarchaeota archaeon]
MADKKAITYARELLKRGYTKDAARDILFSKGMNESEANIIIRKASKPEKNINISHLLLIAIALIIMLIPIMFILTKGAVVTEPENSSINSVPANYQKTVENYKCSINEDCFYDEVCINQQCVRISCNACEYLVDHSCVPMTCDDSNACTDDSCSGGICSNNIIENCTKIESNITYECFSDFDCSDGNLSTLDLCKSPEENQSKICFNIIPECSNNDDFCPENCTSSNDNDCSGTCGNNITESPETCDGDCPVKIEDCDDSNACTMDTIIGVSASCNSQCINTEITTCTNDDNCCAIGCNFTVDNDCPPSYTTISTGSFASVQRATQGEVKIYHYEDNTYVLEFGQLFSISDTTLSQSLKVYLAKKPVIGSKTDLDYGNFALGQLKSLSGKQEYVISPYVEDISAYNSIAIYHETYQGVFAYATIS